MSATDFTFSYQVPQSPQTVYDAVLDVRDWWSQRIDGHTDRLGDFTYEVPEIHRTRVHVTELEPGRRVEWRVASNWFAFDPDVDEWADTVIRFDIEQAGDGARLTFTHIGLTPDLDCYEGCATGWSNHALTSLRALITTGAGTPITPENEIEIRNAQATSQTDR